MTSFVQSIKKLNEQDQVTHILKASSTFPPQKYIAAKSSNGKFIFSLKDEESANIAGYALLFLNDVQNVLYTSRDAVRGAYLAQEFLKGSRDTVTAAKKALAFARNSFIKESEEVVSDSLKQAEDLKNKITTLEKATTNQEEQFNALMKDANTRMTNLEKTYDEKMSLQSSVTYWTNKEKTHKTWSKIFGIAIALLATIIIILFVYVAKDVLSENILTTPLWRVTGLLFAFSFGVWMVRLASKIFISHLHLQTDAHERITMIQTYLAMLRNDEAVKEEDRNLILQALFRPSPTGYIKDDSPFVIQDLISKLTGK